MNLFKPCCITSSDKIQTCIPAYQITICLQKITGIVLLLGHIAKWQCKVAVQLLFLQAGQQCHSNMTLTQYIQHDADCYFALDSSRDKGCAQCDHFQFTSLGLGNGKPVTENLLYGISPYVGVMWKPLLRNLSIKEAIIRNLEEDYRNASVDEKCYQGLLAWKNGQGPQGATIKTLWDALVVVPACSEAINALRSEIAPRISHC